MTFFSWLKDKTKKLLAGTDHMKGRFHSKRATLVLACFFLVYIVLLIRATLLTLNPSGKDRLEEIAGQQYQKEVILSPYRGFIFDRRSDPLAISLLKPSVSVNPKIFRPTRFQLSQLSQNLKIPKERLIKIQKKKTYFAWLKRHISQEAANKVFNLGIKGLYVRKEPGRYYPGNSAASNLIGIVGMDYHGLSGIERFFEKTLTGESSHLNPNVDARAKPLYLNTEISTPQKPGANIYLTIDKTIQEIAEEQLAEGVKTARAKSGFAIVSDPHSGQILAMANYPTFNPNSSEKVNLDSMKNFALQDAFEPGSILKSFVIATALEDKKTSPSEIHNCENGELRIDKSAVIHDDHPAPFLSTTDTLVHSSNICIFKIAQRIGSKRLYDSLLSFGIGGKTSSLNFESEGKGSISNYKNWKLIRFANIAFGQGLMSTGLEIMQAYGVLANGGTLLKPYLISKITSSEGEILKTFSAEKIASVINPNTAKEMRKMLAKVVTDGSGKNADTELFTVAGKTGTAEKVDPLLKAYSKDKRVASFVGFAPVDDPHIVVFVVIDEPGIKPYYGGKWAAPVFSKIVSSTLKYLNVQPDKVKLQGGTDVSVQTKDLNANNKNTSLE